MCQIYRLNVLRAVTREVLEIDDVHTGNLPPMPGIFPDEMALIVRIVDGARRMDLFRWGIPGPKELVEHPVTNVRIVKSSNGGPG